MKRVLSLIMALILSFSALQCLPVMSFAADDSSYETESNDEMASANPIITNKAYTGSLSNRNDVDWYKFEIENDNCYFNLTFNQNEHNYNAVNSGWNISIYKDGVKKPLSIKTNERGTYVCEFPSVSKEGTFYVKVEANNKSDGEAPIDCYYDIKVVTHTEHTYKTTTTKATEKKDGKAVTACKDCGSVKKTVVIPKASKITLSKASFDYTGKVITPKVTVKDTNGKVLKNGIDYTVKLSSGRKDPGKYSVKVTFKGNYSGSKTLYFNILPAKPKKLSVTRTASSLKASWKKVTGADGYTVTLYGVYGNVVKNVNTTNNVYTFKKLSTASTYKITVKSYVKISNKKVSSSGSTASIKTVTTPGKPTLQLAPGERKAYIYCTEPHASGYEIFMRSGKSYEKIATVKTEYKETGIHFEGAGSTFVNGVCITSYPNTEKYVKTGLKKETAYSFKVRAYKTFGGKKIYSDFSSVKKITVK